MKLSQFRNARDNSPEVWEISWPDFKADLLNPHLSYSLPEPPPGTPLKAYEENAKLAQMAFSPASYKGSRAKGNVEAIYLAVADLDHVSIASFKATLEHLVASGLDGLVYTGWSHGINPQEVSARVIVPFASPVRAADWDLIWPRAMTALGVKADPQCRDTSRIYFLPACPSYRHHLAKAFPLPGTKALDVGTLTALPVNLEVAKQIRGERNVERDELVRLARALSKDNPLTGNALKAMLDGEPWESREGFKDDTLFKVVSALARALPDINPASLHPFFTSCYSTFTEPEKEREKVEEKYRRLVDRGIERVEEEKIGHLSSRNARISEAFRGQRTAPYTSEEEATVDPHEWVIQFRTSWYLYVVGRGYVGPFGLHDATPAAHTYLSPSSLRLTELTLSGDLIDKDIRALTREYGSVASGLVLDMTQERATYDRATAILVEAPCPKRKITPKFSVGVDTWLRLLAGTKYEKLEQWLAFSTSLDLPCSALFLEGDPGAGKSLLATGLSYLYTTNGPCALSQVMGNFNQSLSECPIVFADETAPTDMRGKARTAELREIIQATSRHYTRKNLPAGTLKGACRILIAANNAKIFEGEDTLTPADIEAITGRILHIKVGPKAAKYLTREGWAQGQGREEEIAAHVTWLTLHAFRPVSPPRFLVSDAADLARAIATSTTLGSAVAHYLVAALLNKCQRLRANPPDSTAHLLRVIGGRLYVSPRCLIEYWKAYETNVPAAQATSKRVTAGLHGFSNGPEEVGSGVFYQIRVEDLVAWAQSTGMATGEELRLSMVALEDIGAKGATGYSAPAEITPRIH